MTPKLKTDYAESSRPYIEAAGPIMESVLGLRSWRYLIELNSACNLHCALCVSGNSEGYDRPKGNQVMSQELLERVLDKIKSENPNAILCPYGNGEPFLHPRLPESLAAIKRRGFRCELATNLNHLNRLEEVLQAGPDFMIVSTSGFTQEVYGKAHRGGDIERMKANLRVLAETRNRVNTKVHIAVSYHMYRYNLGEDLYAMKQLTESLGLQFMISWARVISIENTVQSLRWLDRVNGVTVPDFDRRSDGQDWNTLLPESKPEFVDAMKMLSFHPERAREVYARFPVPSVCVIADVFTYIRHDGTVQLCAWTDDKRLALGNYLDMTQDQLSEARRYHPLCKECLRYRLNLYFHVVDCNAFNLQ